MCRKLRSQDSRSVNINVRWLDDSTFDTWHLLIALTPISELFDLPPDCRLSASSPSPSPSPSPRSPSFVETHTNGAVNSRVQGRAPCGRGLEKHLPSKDEVKAELKVEAQQAKAAATSQVRNLVAGGVGGICAVVVGHPFDLVKVRMQTAERGVYSSAVDVARKTIAREGLARGLYAGVSAPLVGVTPMFMVSFWGYGVGKSLVESLSPVPVARQNGMAQYTVGQISAAGFFSAIPMTLITAPFERVKVLLQIQGQKTLAPGENPNTPAASTSSASCTARGVSAPSSAAPP